MSYQQYYQNYCRERENSYQMRTLCVAPTNVNRKILDFASNDYLRLSRHPHVIAAAQEAALKYGVGSTGARLLSGNIELFEIFERQIAEQKKCQSSLIFNSGYQANAGILASLCNKEVLNSQALVFFDKYNHASLYEGILLAQAELIRYRHADMDHLQSQLNKFKNDLRPKFIVSETIFGMDGDIIDLAALIKLAEQYHAFLYLDEAHATGIIGDHGYGLADGKQLQGLDFAIMGTFSKAIGVCGAYVACSESLKKYLVNHCKSFIYTTAFSPISLAAAQKAWQLVGTLDEERQKLLMQARILRERLQKLNFNTGLSKSHIIPILIGEDKKTMDMQCSLMANNIYVSAIRYPSVPPKTARLRVALTIEHVENDVEFLLSTLEQL